MSVDRRMAPSVGPSFSKSCNLNPGRVMAYFRNNTVNLLNLHYGIHSVAFSGAGAFYIVYLLKAGVPVPGVLGALAAILAVRFAFRPIVVPLVRFGKVIGVLDLDSPNVSRFDDEDRRGLEALADVFLNATDMGD